MHDYAEVVSTHQDNLRRNVVEIMQPQYTMVTKSITYVISSTIYLQSLQTLCTIKITYTGNCKCDITNYHQSMSLKPVRMVCNAFYYIRVQFFTTSYLCFLISCTMQICNLVLYTFVVDNLFLSGLKIQKVVIFWPLKKDHFSSFSATEKELTYDDSVHN